MTEEHTPEEIKYRLSDLGVQIGNIAIEYIADIEKDIELLKNGETLKELQAEVFRLTKACDETQELLDKQIEATYKLDKENTELKEELKDANEKVVHLACNQNKDLKYKLTKAIELLKWALHSDPEHDNLVDFDTKWKEAEQFLSEVDK